MVVRSSQTSPACTSNCLDQYLRFLTLENNSYRTCLHRSLMTFPS